MKHLVRHKVQNENMLCLQVECHKIDIPQMFKKP